MTWTRLRDVRLIPLVFGPLIAVLAVIEVRLDDFFGATATATATWVPGAVMGAGLMLAARYPLTGTLIVALCLPAGMVVFGAPGVSGASMAGMIGAVMWTGWREPPPPPPLGPGPCARVVAGPRPAAGAAGGRP
ncbi:hypothetical protein FXF51_44825, partial [Nonomuraea sp. PA05]|uniref:hypothetical protein n=1 Tax=Nonomuraea sp. PA05 TaxID=2604466 RepID=UPI0011DB2F86